MFRAIVSGRGQCTREPGWTRLMTATPQERLYKIVEDGVCIGCGLCEAVAGREKVRAVKVTTSNIRPVATTALDHEAVDRIYDVCPGTRVDGLPERLIDENTLIDHVWGAYQRIVLAHAGEPEVRFEGSTGGVLTALGIYLLESGRVDFRPLEEETTRVEGRSLDRLEIVSLGGGEEVEIGPWRFRFEME